MTGAESELTRRRRLSDVWRASAPTREEIAELRARIERRPRRARRSRGKVIAVAVVQGLFFGGATLAAAAWIAGRALPRTPVGHAALVVPATARPAWHPRPDATARPEQLPPAEPMPAAAFEDVTAVVRPPSGAGTTRAEGRSLEKARARVAEPRSTTPAPSPSSAAAAPASLSPAIQDGPWTRVAQALSAGDWVAADRALGELAASADPSTRDAAELTRAELSIAHGQGNALSPVVERLARSGATPLIRERAEALLERLSSR